MQFTQIITILAVAVAGVVAAPGGHGPPPPPPPPPAKPTSVVQQVCTCCQLVTSQLRSNSGFRFLAMATRTRSAALQLKLVALPAGHLRFHLSTAMELQFAATTTKV